VRDLEDRRFLGLLEAAPDAMVCVETDGRIALVNAQAERLFGYERDELIGQRVEMLVPEPARAVHPEHRARYIADPVPRPMGQGMELAGRRRDGSTFPAEISLSAIETEEGVLVTAAVRDVTAQHRTHETTVKLASIIQSSHEAVIGKNSDFVVTSWNPAAERLYGYSAKEMVGQQIQEMFPAEDYQAEEQMLNAVLLGDRVEDHLTRRICKDGTVIDVSLSLSPITNAGGQITGISTVARDVTERQRAEARFVGLLEAAPDAMVCVEADGRIALVNAQAERLFGYARSELVGRPVEILVPEGVREVHPQRRARYTTDPRPRPMGQGTELAGRRQDGSTFPAEISLSAIETDQGILVTAAVRDVSDRLEARAEHERLKTQAERDRLERQLQQSQRLESLGQLAGGVAHDFNNLLGVISSYAAFVAEEVTAPAVTGLSESVASDIEQVQLAAHRAAGLTHQLLAFARREIVQPQIANLNEVVASVLKLLQRTLGEHVELVTELDRGLGLVMADPGRIEQILVNLAVNSRDAMPRGGKLTIATANTEVDEAYALSRANLAAGRYVALKVSDTGTGMSPDVIDRAFEPFFTTKPKGEGSGLGLATIYGIVTQAGGNVRIYSEPGLGTTVTVLLPRTEQEPSADDAAGGRPEGGGNELVLVVEDESALREVTRRILAKNGYRVIVAANGHEAIEATTTSEEPIDVLLTDVVMPGSSGPELKEQLKARQPDLKVLYMSGYTEETIVHHGVLDPGIAFLHKPFTSETLGRKIREILGG
jgi:two-component system, cell cycle sensor histidine kinase and response regulator CckA